MRGAGVDIYPVCTRGPIVDISFVRTRDTMVGIGSVCTRDTMVDTAPFLTENKNSYTRLQQTSGSFMNLVTNYILFFYALVDPQFAICLPVI